jgi:uncharacterized protein with PCYCGC motif
MIGRLSIIAALVLPVLATGVLAGIAVQSQSEPGAQKPAGATRAGTDSEVCSKQDPRPSIVRPYHKTLPTGLLPQTLDPAQFKENRKAFVGYSIAAQIKELLYQEPCYCPCNKMEGHQSLLDCFTSNHSEFCRTCQSEVFFIYEQNKLGKTAAEIREALEKGEAFKSDPTAYADAHYDEYAQPRVE